VGISILLGILVIGCGGSETGGSEHSSGHESSTTASSGTGGTGGAAASSSSTGAGGSGGAGGAASADPEPPIMQSVGPLSGGLHVTWQNVTMDCSAIELDRKQDNGAYALATTVTGAATSYHDSQVTASSTYCYKARCKKGTMLSADSNEKCGAP
jgi:hypothetical protein